MKQLQLRTADTFEKKMNESYVQPEDEYFT